MLEAIGGLLPSAVGVALSPVPIIAVILMLATPSGRGNGIAFAVGWVVGLLVVSVAVLLLAGSADRSGGASTTTSWVKLGLGVAFLVLAVRQWRKRPEPGAEAPLPAWMQTVDTFGTGRSLGLGAVLSGVNPKNFALSVASGASIAQAGLSAGGDAVAVAVYAVIGSLTVVGPVLLTLVAPRRASATLAHVKGFMGEHNAAIMTVLFLVLGAKLVGDGLSGVVS
jgi:threonine/homoserine/homoserine lactone efflux protein